VLHGPHHDDGARDDEGDVTDGDDAFEREIHRRALRISDSTT
jgi:hypothetical protein